MDRLTARGSGPSLATFSGVRLCSRGGGAKSEGVRRDRIVKRLSVATRIKRPNRF